MRIVAISDTHEKHGKITLPEGDVLVHSGDITGSGSAVALSRFAEWLKIQPFKHKIIVAGNHDFCFERDRFLSEEIINSAGGTYLCNSGIDIDGYYFYGSPYQPWFYDWAFNLPRGEALRKIWAIIPDKTSVLITHSPPYGILDLTMDNEPVGCNELTKKIRELKHLKAHVFGHIHPSYGQLDLNGVKFVNASICNEEYKPVNAPIVFDI